MAIRRTVPGRKRLVSSNNSLVITEGAGNIDIITSTSAGVLQYLVTNETELLTAWTAARASNLTAEILIAGTIDITADRNFIVERGEPEIAFIGYPRNVFDVNTFRVNVSRITIENLDMRTSGSVYLYVKEGYVTINKTRWIDDVLYNADPALMKTHLQLYSNANNNTGRIIIDDIEHYSQTYSTNATGDIQPIVIRNSGNLYTQLYVIIRKVNSVLAYERFSRVLLIGDVATPYKVTGDPSWFYHPAQLMPADGNLLDGSSLFFRAPVLNRKSLIGFISQTGTAAPTFEELVDEILPEYTRTAAGTYSISKEGAFTALKTTPRNLTTTYDADGNKITIEWIDADHLQIKTYLAADLLTPADAVLNETELRIEVFI